MAFRRRRTFRARPFRRRFRRGRRPVARSSFDKITLFSNLDGRFGGRCTPTSFQGCSRLDTFTTDPACGVPGPTDCLLYDGSVAQPIVADSGNCRCCADVLNLNLVNNAILETFYQDRITIQRMYGDLFFHIRPTLPNRVTYECTSNVYRRWLQLYAGTFAYQWHASIRKKLLSQDPAEIQNDPASPLYGYDWTESSPPWNWQRFGFWEPRTIENYSVMNQGSIVGVCSDTSGGLAVNTLTNGSGIIDTAIDTTCTTVQAPPEGCPQIFDGLSIMMPPWHHLRLRTKRPIVMQRDQSLNLTLATRMVDKTATEIGSWACLDNSGEPAPLNDLIGDYRVEVYARIGATIKYN